MRRVFELRFGSDFNGADIRNQREVVVPWWRDAS